MDKKTKTLVDRLAKMMEKALRANDLDAYEMLQAQMADLLTREWKKNH